MFAACVNPLHALMANQRWRLVVCLIHRYGNREKDGLGGWKVGERLDFFGALFSLLGGLTVAGDDVRCVCACVCIL